MLLKNACSCIHRDEFEKSTNQFGLIFIDSRNRKVIDTYYNILAQIKPKVSQTYGDWSLCMNVSSTSVKVCLNQLWKFSWRTRANIKFSFGFNRSNGIFDCIVGAVKDSCLLLLYSQKNNFYPSLWPLARAARYTRCKTMVPGNVVGSRFKYTTLTHDA